MSIESMRTLGRLQRAGIPAEQARALVKVVDIMVEERLRERVGPLPIKEQLENQRDMIGNRIAAAAAKTKIQLYMEGGLVFIVVWSILMVALFRH